MRTSSNANDKPTAARKEMERSILNIGKRNDKPEDRSGPRQCTSVENDITDGHHVPPGHFTKPNDLEEDRRDDGEMN